MARPVRVALATTLGGDIDGAWRPHTAVAQELPELIAFLHKPLGEIVDICINWPATEGPIDLESIVTASRSLVLSKQRPPRLMVVDGRGGACAKLLVLPHMTSPALSRAGDALRGGHADRRTGASGQVVRDRRTGDAHRTGREREVGSPLARMTAPLR